MTGGEEVLDLVEAARRLGERPADLRRRLDGALVVRFGAFEVERRASTLVAVRRLPSDETPLWRRRAEAERERLRREAAAGNSAARRALAELGEAVPPPRHWSERDEGEGEV